MPFPLLPNSSEVQQLCYNKPIAALKRHTQIRTIKRQLSREVQRVWHEQVIVSSGYILHVALFPHAVDVKHPTDAVAAGHFDPQMQLFAVFKPYRHRWMPSDAADTAEALCRAQQEV
jgi:hypothetical protein